MKLQQDTRSILSQMDVLGRQKYLFLHAFICVATLKFFRVVTFCPTICSLREKAFVIIDNIQNVNTFFAYNANSTFTPENKL